MKGEVTLGRFLLGYVLVTSRGRRLAGCSLLNYRSILFDRLRRQDANWLEEHAITTGFQTSCVDKATRHWDRTLAVAISPFGCRARAPTAAYRT